MSKNWAHRALNRARHRAARKGIEFNLTVEVVRQLWKEQDGKCYWWKIPMHVITDTPRSPYLPSLDRVDSSRGYTVGNVVICCWAANAAKGVCEADDFEDFTDELAYYLCLGRNQTPDTCD